MEVNSFNIVEMAHRPLCHFDHALHASSVECNFKINAHKA